MHPSKAVPVLYGAFNFFSASRWAFAQHGTGYCGLFVGLGNAHDPKKWAGFLDARFIAKGPSC